MSKQKLPNGWIIVKNSKYVKRRDKYMSKYNLGDYVKVKLEDDEIVKGCIDDIDADNYYITVAEEEIGCYTVIVTKEEAKAIMEKMLK